MKRILVPTDFSKEANNALMAAHSIAVDIDAEILLLHVIEDPHFNAFKTIGESHYDPMENLYILKLIEQSKIKLQAIIDDDKFADTKIFYKLDIGNSYSSIVKNISSHKSSLVVMGTKGVGGLEELLIGSVADKLVRYASCPVITVKQCKDLTGIKNIVFATDLKEDQVQVVEDLKEMQAFFDAKIHLIKVYDSIWLKETEVKEKLQLFAEKVNLENYTVNVAKGTDEAESIMEFAAEYRCRYDRHGYS